MECHDSLSLALCNMLRKSDVPSREHVARTSLKSELHPRIGSHTFALWCNARVMAMENARIRTMCAWTSTMATQGNMRVRACVTSWILQRITPHQHPGVQLPHSPILWTKFVNFSSSACRYPLVTQQDQSYSPSQTLQCQCWQHLWWSFL